MCNFQQQQKKNIIKGNSWLEYPGAGSTEIKLQSLLSFKCKKMGEEITTHHFFHN